MRILARLQRRVGARSGRRRQSGPARGDLVGTTAAALRGVDLTGVPRAMASSPAERHLLAFLTSSCEPCQELWPALTDGRTTPAGLRVVIVTPDPATESRRRIAQLAPPGADVVMSSRAWFDYAVTGAPWFTLVAGGIIQAEGHARTWDDVEVLVAQAPSL